MTVTINKQQWPVASEKCSCRDGAWCCVRCGVTFANNLQAGIHEDDHGHTVQWLCPDHGVQPITAAPKKEETKT